MQTLKLFAIFVFVMALAVWLLPSKNEHIAMLLKDKRYEKAFEETTWLYDAGDRQPQTLMHLYGLHERYGNEDEMRQVLKVFAASYPNNIFVKEKLADLYFRSNRYDAYLAQLEGLIDKRPDAKYAQKLLAQLELGGRADEEKRLLDRFATMPFFSAAHAGRLGLIELSLGHRDKALSMLRRMDEMDHGKDKPLGPRLTLFRLLVQTGLAEEAYRRARHWMRFEKNDANLSIMTNQLRARGSMDLAIALATKARQYRPSATFLLADLLIEQKRHSEARRLLDAWRRASSKLSSRDLTRYIKSQLAAKNLPVAIDELQKKGIAQMPPDALIAIAVVMVWQNQSALLKTIRPFFSREAVGRRPLFSAQIFHVEGNVALTRHFLAKVGPRNISRDQNLTWLTLYKKIYGKKRTFEMARTLIKNRQLPRNLYGAYARLARQMGSMSEYERAWVVLGGVPVNTGQEQYQGVGL